MQIFNDDIEEKCGFPAKKYTGTNQLFTFLVGALFSLGFYVMIYPLYTSGDSNFAIMFFHGGAANRSIIPYFIVFLSCWSLAILVVKLAKLRFQRNSLVMQIFPPVADFVVSPHSVNVILKTIYENTDKPHSFILFNRMERVLSNLKNIGRVGDVADTMAAHRENDEAYMEATYNLLKTFIWAIPVLGFIGTVLGLSEAIGGFGAVISTGADMAQLKASLGGVTGGLSTAFETTLIALVAALIIQLLLSWVKDREEHFLDECNDYCHRYIISRLKIVNVQ